MFSLFIINGSNLCILSTSYVSDTTTVMFIVFLLFIIPSRPCVICKKCSSQSYKKCYHPLVTVDSKYLVRTFHMLASLLVSIWETK